jgi:urea transport system substrate-binding protein
VPVARATRFAVEEVNTAGGVLGRPVEIVEADGESDEAVFAAKARKLIEDDGVAVLFGCYTSSSRKRVEEVCRQHGRLLFYSAPSEGLEDSPAVVYLGGVLNQTLIPLVKWAYTDLGRRRFYLLGNDAVYSHSVNAVLEHEIARLGGQVVAERYVPFAESDFAATVAEVADMKADMLINTIDGEANRDLKKALRRAGITPAKMPTVWGSLSEIELSLYRVSELLGDYSAACYFESLPGKENAAFVERFRKRYGADARVNDAMQTAYFGMHLWKRAVEKAGSADTALVRKALPGLAVDAPEGTIRLAQKTQHARRTPRVGKIVEGDGRAQFEVVSPWREPIDPVPYPPWRTEAAWKKFLDGLYAKWGKKWER